MLNPQQIISTLMSNNQAMNNPVIKNAFGLMQNGNVKGLEELARNIAQSKGINLDEFKKQIGL